MPDVSDRRESGLVKTGKLTTIGGAAIAIVFMQLVAFNAIMDALMSVVIFGAGYLAARMSK